MTRHSRSVVSALSLAAMLFAVPAIPMHSAHAGVAANEEAARQLGLAQGDLEAGRPDRAIKAAKSALLLDPTLVDALLVHAMALEAQRDYSKARALALAYQGAAGDEASPEADELLTRVDRAEPVRTSITEQGRKVQVTFAAREHVEDPVLHWRSGRGEWKEAWMERDEQGEWGYSLTLDAPAASKLSWWVETGLGEPLMEQDEDGEGRPFRLAVK